MCSKQKSTNIHKHINIVTHFHNTGIEMLLLSSEFGWNRFCRVKKSSIKHKTVKRCDLGLSRDISDTQIKYTFSPRPFLSFLYKISQSIHIYFQHNSKFWSNKILTVVVVHFRNWCSPETNQKTKKKSQFRFWFLFMRWKFHIFT